MASAMNLVPQVSTESVSKVSFDQHGLWCSGETASSLTRGLGFESWEWKKSCWERQPLNGPCSARSEFIQDSMCFEHRVENQKKKKTGDLVNRFILNPRQII